MSDSFYNLIKSEDGPKTFGRATVGEQFKPTSSDRANGPYILAQSGYRVKDNDGVDVNIGSNADYLFDLGVVAVTDASNYVNIGTINAFGKDVVLAGIVGDTGGLAHFKITQSVTIDGEHETLMEDSDFNTATVAVPYCVPTGIYTTAASGMFQMRIDAKASEYTIWAKKATTNTTLQILGRVV